MRTLLRWIKSFKNGSIGRISQVIGCILCQLSRGECFCRLSSSAIRSGRAAVNHRQIERGLFVTRLFTECKTFLRVASSSLAHTGLSVDRREQILSAKMVEQIADLQPMKTGRVGGVNHLLRFIGSAICFLQQIPSTIVEFDRKPTMGSRQFKRSVGHGRQLSKKIPGA